MKKLEICDDLLNSDKELLTHKFCAPAFIASSFTGMIFIDEKNMIPHNSNKNSIRSGTLTFITFKGENFAITCSHVIEALIERQKEWKNTQFEKYGLDSPTEGLQLFTPIRHNQFHFNYNFTPVPPNNDGNQPDIAIARVHSHSITRLGRQPIKLCGKNQLPETGIASGYPEMQRATREELGQNIFTPKFVTCTATIQVTGSGGVMLQDSIANHNGVDNLSGMSGGPIIWSDDEHFGLVGIIKEGVDIQPKPGQLATEDGICIFGERITPDLLEEWLKVIPKLHELKDESKTLYVSPSSNEERRTNGALTSK